MFSKKRRLQQKVKDLLYALASSTHDHFHDLVLVFLGSEGGARLTLTWSEVLGVPVKSVQYQHISSDFQHPTSSSYINET